jgi:hypothetical protein
MNMRDYPILHLKQNEVREHKKLSNITLEIKIKQGNMRDYPILHLKQNKVREHERLSNITLEAK